MDFSLLLNYPCYDNGPKTNVFYLNINQEMFNYQQSTNCSGKNYLKPSAGYIKRMITIIYTKLMQDYPSLPVLIYDLQLDGQSLLDLNMIQNGDGIKEDRIFVTRLSFINSKYRSNKDIVIPPPILEFYNNPSINGDVCRSRKYLLTYFGNLDQVSKKE